MTATVTVAGPTLNVAGPRRRSRLRRRRRGGDARRPTTAHGPSWLTWTSSHNRRTMPRPRPDRSVGGATCHLRRAAARWTAHGGRRRSGRPNPTRTLPGPAARSPGWITAFVTSSLITSSRSSTTTDGTDHWRRGTWQPHGGPGHLLRRAGTSISSCATAWRVQPGARPGDPRCGGHGRRVPCPDRSQTGSRRRRPRFAPRGGWYKV